MRTRRTAITATGIERLPEGAPLTIGMRNSLDAVLTVLSYWLGMAWARKILCACLIFAVAHFGVMASAPPHAHETGDAHGLAAIDFHPDGDHHPHDDRNDDHEPGSLGSESVLHIHVAPQFTPVEIAAHHVPEALIAALPWPEPSAGPGKGRFNPPLRPPRALL